MAGSRIRVCPRGKTALRGWPNSARARAHERPPGRSARGRADRDCLGPPSARWKLDASIGKLQRDPKAKHRAKHRAKPRLRARLRPQSGRSSHKGVWSGRHLRQISPPRITLLKKKRLSARRACPGSFSRGLQMARRLLRPGVKTKAQKPSAAPRREGAKISRHRQRRGAPRKRDAQRKSVLAPRRPAFGCGPSL